MRGTILSAFAVIGLVSSAAWAGDLRCQVTDKAGPQANVKVTVAPGGTTLTTARDGTCVFRGLPEGTYRVTAEKTVGEELRGAVQDEVRVPARGQGEAKLQLVRAIHIHEYIPLRVGSEWEYNWWKHKRVLFAGLGYIWSMDGREMTYEAAAGRARFAGADVIEVEWKMFGFLVRHEPLYAMYETSGPEGYTIYGRTPRTTNDDSSLITYIPPFRYDPPLLIPDLVPLGHAYRLTTRVRYADDTSSVHVMRTYTLTGFESVRVGADALDDCARIEWTEEAGDTTTTGVTKLAKGVGMVSMVFDDGHVRETFRLTGYHLPAPSAARTLPRAVEPKPPSGTVQTPGKSVPSK
jgi:hypothetical protein